MEKKEFKGLNLNIYEETLANGLRVFICPMKRHKIDARMTVHFGADVLEFIYQGKMKKVSPGIAHFLEHKMFEKENLNISELYEKNGALGNAYTDDHVTVYYFESPDNFYENLKTLLKCVHEPYFTSENITKEIGIIEQELKATLSDADTLAYNKAKHNSYKYLPYKYPIIGTEESIKQITKDDLYSVYNTFYVPVNMHLIITGNVNPQEVIKFLNDYYKNSFKKAMPVIKKYNEPKEVVLEKEIILQNINNKMCCLNYKIDLSNFNLSPFILQRYLNVLLLNNFSSLSGFTDLIFQNKNILSPVYWFMDIESNFANISFSAEVNDENVFLDIIEKQLQNFDIMEKKLELIKKNWISQYLINTEKVVLTSEIINEQIIKYGNIVYDSIDKIKSLNKDLALEVYKNLDFSNNKSLAIVQKG